MPIIRCFLTTKAENDCTSHHIELNMNKMKLHLNVNWQPKQINKYMTIVSHKEAQNKKDTKMKRKRETLTFAPKEYANVKQETGENHEWGNDGNAM